MSNTVFSVPHQVVARRSIGRFEGAPGPLRAAETVVKGRPARRTWIAVSHRSDQPISEIRQSCGNRAGAVFETTATAVVDVGTRDGEIMKRYLIEREIPGASELTEAELSDIAAKSNDVVANLGVPYRWITSYVAGDKIYCVHEAPDENAVRAHARRGGFPADKVAVLANEFGPESADT